VSDTDQVSPVERRILILTIVYGAIFSLPTSGGVLLSFTAQPGGISPPSAFLAPLLGPWSQTLSPNPHPVSTWSPRYAAFARCLAVMLAFSFVGSYLAPSRWLRYFATIMAVPTLIIWLLAGLMKVVSQLA